VRDGIDIESLRAGQRGGSGKNRPESRTEPEPFDVCRPAGTKARRGVDREVHCGRGLAVVVKELRGWGAAVRCVVQKTVRNFLPRRFGVDGSKEAEAEFICSAYNSKS